MANNNEIITAKSSEDRVDDYYKGKNVVKLEDDVYRRQISGAKPTNKAIKKKKLQITKVGRFFCNCGFAFATPSGDKNGDNMKFKVRLHNKVCPIKK